METSRRLKFSAVTQPILISVCVLLFVLLIAIALDGCATVQKDLKLPGTAACLEFWLERYQTLLSAIAAAVAAVFLWRQLKATEDQVKKTTELMNKQEINLLVIEQQSVEDAFKRCQLVIAATRLANNDRRPQVIEARLHDAKQAVGQAINWMRSASYIYKDKTPFDQISKTLMRIGWIIERMEMRSRVERENANFRHFRRLLVRRVRELDNFRPAIHQLQQDTLKRLSSHFSAR